MAGFGSLLYDEFQVYYLFTSSSMPVAISAMEAEYKSYSCRTTTFASGSPEWYSALIIGTIVSIMSLGATVIGIAFKCRKDSLHAAASTNDFT
jgi:hypothetical protein